MGATIIIRVFWMTLKGSYLEQLCIFWKCVHAFYRNSPPMVLLEVNKSQKVFEAIFEVICVF